MRGDLSLRTALTLYPLVPDDMVDENIKELEAERLGVDDYDEPSADE